MDAVKRDNVHTNKMANKDALRKTGFEPANMLRNGTVACPLRNNISDVIVAMSGPYPRALLDAEVEKKDVIASRSGSSFGDRVGGVRIFKLSLKSIPNPKFHALF